MSLSKDFSMAEFLKWNELTVPAIERLRDAKRNGTEPSEVDKRLQDVHSIAAGIADEGIDDPSKVRALRDSKGNVQSAALVTNEADHLYIDYVVSAPWNAGGDDDRAVKGAGTAMMRQLIQESIDSGHGGKIKLEAIDAARPFYEKLGFTYAEDDFKAQYGLAFDMELSPKAAKLFLERTKR